MGRWNLFKVSDLHAKFMVATMPCRLHTTLCSWEPKGKKKKERKQLGQWTIETMFWVHCSVTLSQLHNTRSLLDRKRPRIPVSRQNRVPNQLCRECRKEREKELKQNEKKWFVWIFWGNQKKILKANILLNLFQLLACLNFVQVFVTHFGRDSSTLETQLSVQPQGRFVPMHCQVSPCILLILLRTAHAVLPHSWTLYTENNW